MSLPANTQRTVSWVGDTGIPVQVQRRLTAPHLQVGTVATEAAKYRAWGVDDVFFLHHDVRVVSVGEHGFELSGDQGIAVVLVPAVIGAESAVVPSIVVAKPEGLHGDGCANDELYSSISPKSQWFDKITYMTWDYDNEAFQKQAQADPAWGLERLINYGGKEVKLNQALLKQYLPQLNIPENRRDFLELLLWNKPF